MTTRKYSLILALVVAATVVIVAWQLWPSETRRVRRKLDEIASVVNERPGNGIGQLTRTAQLSKFLTDDVVLDPGRGAGEIRGRERLLALASRAPNDGSPYTLEFVDVRITLQGEQSATAHLTATLSARDADTGEPKVDAREAEVEFRHTDDWRIARITLIDTLEKPQP